MQLPTASSLRRSQSLKEAFPGVKFSVRSRTYSCGAPMSVSWIDGPNAAQVESITKGLKASYFDGSVDYQGSSHRMMDGEQARFGADHVTTTRIYSDAAVERALIVPTVGTLATFQRLESRV